MLRRAACDCDLPTSGFQIGEYAKCPACSRWWIVRRVDSSPLGAWMPLRRLDVAARRDLTAVLAREPHLAEVRVSDLLIAAAL